MQAPTQVSVGVLVINLEQSRTRQKIATSNNRAGVFYVDFLLSLRAPPASGLEIDHAVWQALSFRNAKEIYLAADLPGSPGTRRYEGAFYYDPDLHMYPVDAQDLSIIVQQTQNASNEWVFVPSSHLNGMSATMGDMGHKECSVATHLSILDGQARRFSTFTFSVRMHNPRWYVVITAFVPPVLVCLPVMLSYTLGPLSWYPLRFMVAGINLVSLAFFYDSYLRQVPELDYLTVFDKFIYCIYIWLIAGIISLARLVYVFSDAMEAEGIDPEHWQWTKSFSLRPVRAGSADDRPLLLSVHLRDDCLHLSIFSAVVRIFGLCAIFFLWVWVSDVVMIFVLFVAAWWYFSWMHGAQLRVRAKNGEAQHHSVKSDALNASKSKGREFHWEVLLCCCYRPILDMLFAECCWCQCCAGPRPT
eukprot:890560-Rhodomonas_salina.1